MMKVGITGTREGMNEHQFAQVQEFLSQFPAGTEFHHGDCVGVDVEAAMVARELGYRIIAHPGPAGDLQAGHDSDEIREHLTHFKRNRNIVDETDMLMVVPLQNKHQSFGGTWYTHDYAVKKNKPVTIFYPGENDE